MKLFRLIPLLLLTLTINAHAKDSNYSSAYTSLKECKVIESSANDPKAEIDYFSEECPGKANYRIFHEGGDSRSWIVIKKGNSVVINLQNEVMQNAPGNNFRNVSGKVAEWRYKGSTPIAFIFRIAGNEEKSKLFVVRLGTKKACVIGVTTSNVEARKIADSQKMCP